MSVGEEEVLENGRRQLRAQLGSAKEPAQPVVNRVIVQLAHVSCLRRVLRRLYARLTQSASAVRSAPARESYGGDKKRHAAIAAQPRELRRGIRSELLGSIRGSPQLFPPWSRQTDLALERENPPSAAMGVSGGRRSSLVSYLFDSRPISGAGRSSDSPVADSPKGILESCLGFSNQSDVD